MRKLFSRFYTKISLIVLALLLILSILQLLMFAFFWTWVADDSDQLLNWELASNLSEKWKPLLRPTVDYFALRNAFYEARSLFPGIEIFVLDQKGKIKTFYGDKNQLTRLSVEVEPIEKFLRSHGKAFFPVYGSDPFKMNEKSVFSASRITLGNQAGYVYLTLGNRLQRWVQHFSRTPYIVQTTVIAIAASLFVTASIGFLIFFFLSRRLYLMTKVVDQFDHGNYQERIKITSRDELGELGHAFNKMSDRLVESINEVKQTDFLRRELVANISHDLRGPLSALQGFLETILLEEVKLSEAERKDFLAGVFENVKILIRMVHELFELSKLEARISEPSFETFSLSELIEFILLKFESAAEKQEISISCSDLEDDILVYSDRIMVERILSNLIDNAIRYNSATGEVKVFLNELEEKQDDAGESKGVLLVVVKDSGIGIASEDLPRIFDRYYRVTKEHAPKIAGTGLGLAIVKKMVEAIGSKIQVESKLNQGTSFSFKLRMAIPENNQ